MDWVIRWSFPLRLLILITMMSAASATAVPPEGFVLTEIERPDGNPWNEAVGLTFDAQSRMFVWERGGRAWIVDEQAPVATPLFDISEEVGAWDDHGMLGFALDPDYAVNGYLYLFYIVDRHYWLHCTEPADGGPSICDADYDSEIDEYEDATFGRITRYTAILPPGASDYHDATEIDLASRKVLLGETPSTGAPTTWTSHGVGTLVFAADGTLLVSMGDGSRSCAGREAGCIPDIGADPFTYAAQALADGIITATEDVGAYRSQLINSHAGKILRLDPATGDGVPSNPFFDASAPRAPRSRVWALGLRNPFRMALRPESGSSVAADGDPGVIYVGDVGWKRWEDLNVVTGPGQNFGWPVFEGMTLQETYSAEQVPNRDAPNPLFDPDGGCGQAFFFFTDLMQQDRRNPASLLNPCDDASPVPPDIPTFVHRRPAGRRLEAQPDERPLVDVPWQCGRAPANRRNEHRWHEDRPGAAVHRPHLHRWRLVYGVSVSASIPKHLLSRGFSCRVAPQLCL
ncbi:PQQ-dependent sugar dehydrogenase [Candidatus Entotheonella palauensis]|uniref:PQQ-dependent sugar dehydrogenase n=1 Tax=Candidatus Entotheonella palauensis TaxID=93172 RepID=UPI000B7CD1CE|nr:PQQ-dependent sugar dehydrogenase [Candidatus Entotheonella palauensis]